MIYPKMTTLIIVFFILFNSQIVSSQETLNWTNDIPPGGWPGATLGPYSNSTQCHSRGVLTSQVLNPLGFAMPSGTPLAAAVNSNSIIFGMSGVPDTQGITQTMNFTYPVENLSFSIFDIDGGLANWQDRLIITASLSGLSVPVTINTCPAVAGTVCTGSGTISAQIDAGTNGTGFTDAAGRADLTIAGSLDSVTIQYLNHTVPVSTTQFISITELTYNCAIVGVSKLMTRRAGQAFGISPYIVDIDFNFENFGDVTLSNLTALEDLDAVFNIPPNSGNFSVTSISQTSGPASFSVNAAFDGSVNQELIGAGSSLLSGETASIRVSLNVNNYDSYINIISVDGTTPQLATTSDDSTDGTDSDGADADDNPDESLPSPLNTTTLPVSLNYLSSQKNQDNVTVKWQTDIEFGHIGFKLFQEDITGKKYELSNFIYQADKQFGQSLKTYTAIVNTESSNPIWLAEYDNKGATVWYGPFEINTTTGTKIANSKIDWLANNKQAVNLKTSNNTLAIEVKKTGMQRITYASLIQAGMNLTSVSPKSMSITLNNEPIPIFINGNQYGFDSTSSIDFYASGINSLYTNKRIYKLNINAPASIKIKLDETMASTAVDAWYWQTESYNPNLVYDFSSPTDDPWRAETLATFGTLSKNIAFPLDELASVADTRIVLDLQITGGIDYQQAPDIYPTDSNRCGASYPDIYPGMPNDHCLKMKINNLGYDDLVFDGLSSFSKQYQLDSSVSAIGVINVELNLAGDAGFAHDIVNIENISIKYPRNLSAINDSLQFIVANSSIIDSDLINVLGFEDNNVTDNLNQVTGNKASILVDGFSNNKIVAYALNPKAPVRINNIKIDNSTEGYAVKVPSIAQTHRYWISTEQSLIKPNLKPWHQSQSIESSDVEYIIISHPDFIETTLQLKNYHQANGLNVELINVEDIYAKYSSSVVDAYAIKKYIVELARNNRLKYVLLVGADNYDYKGYLSALHYSHIPSIYTAIDGIVRYAPADSLYVDIDNDDIPDLAIGRLPVRTNQELQLLIDKQMVFVNQTSPNLSSHFIADSASNGYSYSQISDELSNLLPEPWIKLSTYRDNYADATITKQQILNNFALNPRLTTYLGHSGPRNWFSFPSAFTYNDIASLDNSSSPSVVMQWGCWNSYYVEPDANTMAHKFLFDSDKGAVAVFGASALTTVTSEIAFAQLIIPELTKQGQTLGSSMLKAKKLLSKNGGYRDIIIGWNLLGDPALKLQ